MGLALDRVLSEYDEDAAHTSGDTGQYVLAVVQTTLASSAADGDYGSFKTNLKGEQYTIDTDGNALLTTIDADTGSILADTTSMVGLLTTIDADTGAIATSVASIDSDTTTIATNTTTIAGDTTSMDATLTALSKAEDSIHVSADQGIMSLAVRSDADTPFAADGDYTPLATDDTGALKVSGTFTVGTGPDNTIDSQAVTVGVAEVALPTTPEPGRDSMIIQNLGSSSIFVGPTGVLTTTGLEISKRSSLEISLGPSVAVFGISGTAGQDVRVFETA